MACIVQLANFIAPTSGGIRTVVDALASGYADAGHERVLIVPGEEDGVRDDRVHIRGRRLPGQPYRVITDIERVRRVVKALRPDRVELSDKLTLPLAAPFGVPTVLVSHERIDGILQRRVPPGFPLGVAADIANRRLRAAADVVVCASSYAAEEWRRVGVAPRRVPLGVDLDTFAPAPERRPVRSHAVELGLVGRLSAEKHPLVAVAAAARLRRSGVDARLTIAGAGPLQRRIAATAARRGVPVRFVGHVADRAALAALLGGLDVVVCPCPHETFGLAALEAMACGTPVAVPASGGLAELVTTGPPGCGAVDDDLANAVQTALRCCTRDAARAAASCYPWRATVDGFLAAHGLAPAAARTAV